MKRTNNSLFLTLAFTLGIGLIAQSANAGPTDSGFPWSWGGLRVNSIIQGGDSEVYVTLKNPDGSVRSIWPDARGVDLCGGKPELRITRARTNFKELVDGFNAAGLAGRTLWVAYEPTGGICYVKAMAVAM